ncbi:MAG: hypothetical protein R2864_08185 [Syntrophotaleaceae bacterium]
MLHVARLDEAWRAAFGLGGRRLLQRPASLGGCERVIATAESAFTVWRSGAVLRPQRGEVVRQIGQRLRLQKQTANLVSYEMGKLTAGRAWRGSGR